MIAFLSKNDYLNNSNGELKVSPTALSSIALLIAQSNPNQKDLMIEYVMNVLRE